MSYPPQDDYNDPQPPATPGSPGQGYPQRESQQQGWYPQPPYPQQAYAHPGQPLGYAGPLATVQDNSGRAKTAFVLLWVMAGLAVLQVVYGIAAALLIDFETMVAMQSPDPAAAMPTGAVLALFGVAFCFGVLFLAVWVVTIVFYMMWQHRAFFNARAVGQQTTFSPGWSVGWWFIPLANLVAIGLVLRDLWRATAGRGDAGGLPTLIWVLIVTYFALALTSGIMNAVAIEVENSSLYHASSALGIGNSLLGVAFWALLALFVRRVQVAQTSGQ